VAGSHTSALEEAERLGRLANDLLSLARATAGTLTLRPEPVDVRDLASAVVDRLEAADGTTVDVTGGPSPAVVDRDRLEQVVTNLVANARRHARQRVTLSVAPAGGGVDLVIADDGPGFPPELLPVVFDRFTRADPARGRDADSGAGLGLAIAAAIVHAHRGTIKASNGPPLGGAVVRVHIPAAENGDRAGAEGR
jgi:signal transduction histidine kinase